MHNRRLPRLLMVAALGLLPSLLSAAFSFAQAPPAVPALPDTERRTSYSLSGTTCGCSVGFALYGTGSDVDQWIEVWVAGTRYLSTDPSHGWALTSATGTLATIPRPITNAVLTFTAVQTGTVQIVGAERPRRTAQFAENRGVAARDLNQALTDITAVQRETWDRTSDTAGRAILGLPGEIIAQMPAALARQGGFLCFDATGLKPLMCAPTNGTGNMSGPNSSVSGDFAQFSGTTGKLLQDVTPLAAEQALQFLQSGTGAVQRSLDAKLKGDFALSIKDFGAVCDGSTDDTAAIQAAINALPVNGGDIIFPSSLTACKVTSTIFIGNGTSSAVSTRYGVHLLGQGAPIFPFVSGYPTAPPVKILWAGGASAVIKIRGPLQGWGVSNLYIDCSGVASQGLWVNSGQFGYTENLVLDNCITGISSTTFATFGGASNTNSIHNQFVNTNIRVPEVVNSFGILLTGTTTSNTDSNTFINTWITLPSTVSSFGIYLQASDSNLFFDTHLAGGNGGAAAITFDYSVANVWPASNGFYGLDPAISGSSYVNTGAIGGGASPNWIYGLVKTNGAVNPNIANLVFLSPDAFRLCGSTGNSGCINFNTQTSFTGYNFNWPVTAGTVGQVLASGGGGSTAMTWLGQPVILGGFATGVNLNTTNTDTAITITSPTANYKVDRVTVFNTGTTASLTTATAGLFTATGGGGLAIAGAQALSGITSNAINTDTNSLDLTTTVGSRTTINSATLQFRNAVAQGAAATGSVYVWIRPEP